uniref:ABC-F family ATP-binding cassette domain-containing protein n=1 Tax=Alloprevotella tannerae TaxID=76122 RepID=UPI0028EFAEB4
SSGSVAIEKEATIGYLPQVMVLSDDHTVIEETEKAFSDIRDLQLRIERENKELAERDDYESQDYLDLVERFAHDNDRFQLMGGLNYRAQMERTLLGLGFVHEDFDRPTKEFSGGWHMRIELAKILLRSPDILLLDEPTNHLDIESIRWLEQFLQHSASAVVLVSHDRAFLNNVTNRTIEISCGRITDYKAKYDDFVRLREERREQQLRAYENQQKEIADIKDFIERFRYKPTKAVQVQSRIKQLEKIVPIVVDEVDRSSLHLKFPPCSRTGDYPLICEDLRKDYGPHCVFHNVNLTLKREEKVAFVGKNGAGKSTLVKCIMGEIPYTGSLKLGHNVAIGYYAQNQAQLLDENLTVFDTIDSVAKGDIRLKIRDILGAFMFGGEASDKKVKVLSGGERSRLAMIRLLLEPVNFLILDEPTNHLDMRTKDVLKEAIQAFDGTVILVSHDRDFLDGLVTKVYEFGNGLVREHLGGIYDFLRKKELQDLKSLEAASTQSTTNTDTPRQAQGKLSYEEQKEQARQLRKVEKEVKEREEAISRIEATLQDLEQQMSTPEGAADAALITQYAAHQKELEQTMADWEAAASRLEEIQSK